MTDNLKQRIAEAINGAKHFDDILPAVLDIVEPLLPKWVPINESTPRKMLLLYSPKYGINVGTRGDLMLVDNLKHTHWMPLPTPPAKG